ncbi:dienelactone hydrolase family protein [Synechococcus sp. AH-601-N10]|nr:dienelactone hydrolase family protein [Synechococcus sp. AH-601-N10]
MKLRSNLSKHLTLSLLALFATLLNPRGIPEALADQTSYTGTGPFSVSVSIVEGQGLLFKPSDSDEIRKNWPGVVFAHGICGPAEKYSSSLSRLASWGFMVIANQKQGDCGVMNVNHPLATLGNFFQLRLKFHNAADFSLMADDIRSNLNYLIGRSDVDSDRIALMGHSMGGGMVIDVASELGKQQSNIVKAVVAIAPWNGVHPTPSSIVNDSNAPILIFCSMTDALCPCSGEVQLSDTQGIFTKKLSPIIPLLFGPQSNPTWNGGSMAILKNSKDLILMNVSQVSHLSIAGIDHGDKMQSFAEWARSEYGLNFNRPSRSYSDIPTMEYSVAFLNQFLSLDVKKGQSTLEQSSSDSRLLKVLRSN